jgi:hypothetical protein
MCRPRILEPVYDVAQELAPVLYVCDFREPTAQVARAEKTAQQRCYRYVSSSRSWEGEDIRVDDQGYGEWLRGVAQR